jgi:hypothetical protein
VLDGVRSARRLVDLRRRHFLTLEGDLRELKSDPAVVDGGRY